MTKVLREFLLAHGLPDGDSAAAPDSARTFPDGAQYRVEIPSVEGPAALEAVLDEADRRGVIVHRVSQGSGGLLTTDAELSEMAHIAHEHNTEVSLFTRPTASWDVGAAHLAPTGAALGSQARGMTQVVHCLQEITRIADAGIRSVLVTDLGVLHLADEMRTDRVDLEVVAFQKIAPEGAVTFVGKRLVDLEVIAPTGQLEAVVAEVVGQPGHVLKGKIGPLAGEQRDRAAHDEAPSVRDSVIVKDEG